MVASRDARLLVRGCFTARLDGGGEGGQQLIGRTPIDARHSDAYAESGLAARLELL